MFSPNKVVVLKQLTGLNLKIFTKLHNVKLYKLRTWPKIEMNGVTNQVITQLLQFIIFYVCHSDFAAATEILETHCARNLRHFEYIPVWSFVWTIFSSVVSARRAPGAPLACSCKIFKCLFTCLKYFPSYNRVKQTDNGWFERSRSREKSVWPWSWYARHKLAISLAVSTVFP